MGLEPMTSPLPRECSTTELHQPLERLYSRRLEMEPLPLYRERKRRRSIRNAEKPSSNHVTYRNFPGCMVCHARIASTASTVNPIANRPSL
jgi:hypothetical protein